MKRIIATLLSVLMIFGMVNISALAEEEVVTDEIADVTETEASEEVELPNAVVTKLNVQELKETDDIELTYALNFKPGDITEEQALKYGNWYADYVLTINKEATFNADGSKDGYLAGQYDEWSVSWVTVPFEDRVIEADTPFKVMETAAEIMGQPGLKITCAEAFDVVKDFDCGVYFTDDFISNNPGLIATLELRIYNPENESESYPVCDVYEFKVVASTTEENVVVQGTMVTESTVEIKDVKTDEITEGTTTVTIDTNDFVEDSTEAVDTVVLPVAVVETVEALDDATLNITLANGDGTNVTVSISKDALTAIKDIANEEGATNIVLKVEKAEEEDLESEQQDKVTDLDNTQVYTITFETTDGTSVFSEDTAQEDKTIKVGIPYTKDGNGQVVAKHLKTDGTLEDVDFTYEDGVVILTLGHFSDYVIYQKRPSSSISYTGGGSVSKCTVRFDTDGGSAVSTQNVNQNDKVTEPEAPTKDGYIFEGWYTDNSFTTAYDFETAVTKGFTLYAKWAEETKTDEEQTDDADADVDVDVADVWFEDVNEADWFYSDVKYVSDNKLMNGVNDSTFAPNGLLTRAMLVTILYRNEGEPAVNRSIPFADIDMGAYYANAVIWAQQNGIVNGVTETEFAPDENITREQIAAIMFRYAISKGLEAVTLEENLSFADAAEISEYAISAMNWAVGNGLMKGKTESTLNPQDNTTRAEVAAVIRRYIEGNAQN